jgi:hypothetical protein
MDVALTIKARIASSRQPTCTGKEPLRPPSASDRKHIRPAATQAGIAKHVRSNVSDVFVRDASHGKRRGREDGARVVETRGQQNDARGVFPGTHASETRGTTETLFPSVPKRILQVLDFKCVGA